MLCGLSLVQDHPCTLVYTFDGALSVLQWIMPSCSLAAPPNLAAGGTGCLPLVLGGRFTNLGSGCVVG